jgi:uncharacterized membrane protein
MPRWLLPTALFVSLALNVFVVGAFVGGRLAGGKPEAQPSAEMRPRNPVMAAVRTLSPEQQAAWRAQMPEFAQNYGPRVRDARRTVRETMRSFGDEPFDAGAKIAALRKARAVEQAGRMEMDRRLVTFAATLPAADRARFGEALARPTLGRRGGGGRGDGAALPER